MIDKKQNSFLAKRLLSNFSPSYYSALLQLKKTEYLTHRELEEMQLKELKKILIYAYATIPYYKKAFDSAGVVPGQLSDLSDIQNYPFLNKRLYRKNLDQFHIPRSAKSIFHRLFTIVKSGQLFLLLRNSFGDYGREKAYTEYFYQMLGLDASAKTVYIKEKSDDEINVFTSVGNYKRTLVLSGNNPDDEQLGTYVEKIKKFAPVLLHCQPSFAVTLAEFMTKNEIPPFETLRYVLFSSQAITSFQKENIENALNCSIVSVYRPSEHVVFSSQCSMSKLYHELPQYSFIELVDKKGKLITEPGIIGELVCTSFTNYTTPLIRYKTGDFASFTDEKCICGRDYRYWDTLSIKPKNKVRSRIKINNNTTTELTNLVYKNTPQHKIKPIKTERRVNGEINFLVSPQNKTEN